MTSVLFTIITLLLGIISYLLYVLTSWDAVGGVLLAFGGKEPKPMSPLWFWSSVLLTIASAGITIWSLVV